MRNWFISLSLALGFSLSVFAEEQNETSTAGESKIELKDLKPKEEKNDNQITNSRLAADAGSKSKISLRAFLNYSGGSVEKPFDRVRPNYRKLTSNPIDDTMIAGSIGGAYRVDSESQLRFSTGVSMRTPLHNSMKEVSSNVNKRTRRRIFNVSGISAEYNKTFRKGNVMYSPSFGINLATDEQTTNIVGLIGSASASLTTIFDIEGSGWQPGVSGSIYQSVYRDSNMFDLQGRRRENYSLGLYPFAEYKFNDTYAFRTVFGFFNYSNYRDQKFGELFRDGNYISLGVGISPRRDIWVYPNIQFNPNEIRGNLTNVGITTILNL